MKRLRLGFVLLMLGCGAIALAQNTSSAGRGACPNPALECSASRTRTASMGFVDAGVVKTTTLNCTDINSSGDGHFTYLFNSTIAFFGGYIRALTAAGLQIQLVRGATDGNAGLALTETTTRAPEAVALGLTSRGQEVVQITAGGTFHGGSNFWDGGYSTDSVFMDTGSGALGSLGCRGASTGCQVSINGGVLNNSVHASIEIGNNHGWFQDAGSRTQRTGGQIFGTSGGGNSDAVASGGGFRVDMEGNIRPAGLVYTRLRSSNLPKCGYGCPDGGCGDVPKIEFDNSSSTVNDGTGSFRGMLGGIAFNTDPDRLAVCSAESYGLDAGYEYVLTDHKTFPDEQTGSNPSIRRGSTTCSGGTKAVTFGTAFTSSPSCAIGPKTAAIPYFSTGPSTTGFTVTCGGASDAFSWVCVGT